MNMKKSAIALAISAIAMPALALSPSVGDPGFSGSVNLGAGAGQVESNFLAEVAGIDLSDDTISSVGSPDDKSVGIPIIGYDLGWTLSGGNTRIFLADDDRADFQAFDAATQLAIRHDTDNAGNFQLAALFSGAMTRVYQDPYQLDSKRGKTETTSSGGRFTWDKIFSSNFELMAETRKIDIDDEFSGRHAFGSSSPSDIAARKLLEREGDMYQASLGYVFELNDRHTLRPSIGYINYDLDGDAMSRKGGLIELGYGYHSGGYNLLLSGMYGKLDGDKANPFSTALGRNDKNDTDRYQIAGVMEFPGLFGLEKWVPNVSAVYAEDDSDIDFNDAKAWVIGVAMYRAF